MAAFPSDVLEAAKRVSAALRQKELAKEQASRHLQNKAFYNLMEVRPHNTHHSQSLEA